MNSAAAASSCAGRTIWSADAQTVLASAYGRSVPVTRAMVNTTNSTTGSVMAAKVLARLAPSCAYGDPVLAAATAITKLASARMNAPPRMSPM
jgi:hypothetical protein